MTQKFMAYSKWMTTNCLGLKPQPLSSTFYKITALYTVTLSLEDYSFPWHFIPQSKHYILQKQTEFKKKAKPKEFTKGGWGRTPATGR